VRETPPKRKRSDKRDGDARSFAFLRARAGQRHTLHSESASRANPKPNAPVTLPGAFVNIFNRASRHATRPHTALSAHSHITHILMSGAHDTYRYTARARERPPREKYQPMDQRKITPSVLLRTCDKATRLYCGPRARNMYTYTRVWTRANGLRSAAFGNGILRHAYAHAHAKPAAACATALYIQRARGTNDQSAADAAWLASARSSSV
jgi:hypothetical protein